MEISEFRIGANFRCGDKLWRCTDIGKRTVIAIHIDDRSDRSWFNGPPYAVSECVFDENSQKGCHSVG